MYDWKYKLWGKYWLNDFINSDLKLHVSRPTKVVHENQPREISTIFFRNVEIFQIQEIFFMLYENNYEFCSMLSSCF
jgi:hypothetical protein